MKKFILLFIAIFVFAGSFPAFASAVELGDIISEAAVLMDAETGQILFDKNIDKMMYPASTTKIMTALLVAEKCDMEEIATVTKSAIDIDVWGSSNIALLEGEELPVDSLMYALMLPSANDAANVLAEHVAGSQRDFAQMMTERARAIGAFDTRFANAHGLHDPTHYTTARDLAAITREAIKNPVFMKHFGSGTHTIPSTNLQPEARPFTNYQYMLVDTTRFYDSDVIGGKVGYTSEARHTMSTVASKDGRTLICIVLDSPNRYNKFTDTQKLLSFGFDEFTEISIAKERFPGFSTQILDGDNEIGAVDFYSASDFKALLHNSLDPTAIQISYSHDRPFEADESVAAFAEFSAASDDPSIPNLIGRAYLEADTLIFAQPDSAVLTFKGDLSASSMLNKWWSIPAIALAIAFVVSAVLLTIRKINVHKRRKRRRQRLARLQREQSSLYSGPVPMIARK